MGLLIHFDTLKKPSPRVPTGKAKVKFVECRLTLGRVHLIMINNVINGPPPSYCLYKSCARVSLKAERDLENPFLFRMPRRRAIGMTDEDVAILSGVM